MIVHLTQDRRKQIRQSADRLLRKYRGYPWNFELLQRVAQDHGIEILAADLSDIAGVLRQEKGKWRVYINRDDSPTRQLFTLAHELAHYFLHRQERREFIDGEFAMSRDDDTRYTEKELEANEFAGNLIMPSSKIDEKLSGQSPTEKEVLELADRFHVSPLAMVIRLRSLGYNVPHTEKS